MCAPIAIPIAMFAISAASTAYQYSQSNQQANQAANLQQQSYDNQYKQQVDIYNQQRQEEQIAYDRAAQDASLQYQRTLNDQQQKLSAEDQQYALLSRKTQEAAATASTRAAEGGVGGLSVDALMSDYWRSELDSRYALDTERNSIAQQGSNNYYDYTTQQNRNASDFTRNSQYQYSTFANNLQALGLGNQSAFAKINDSRMSPVTAGLNIASSAVSSAALGYQMSNPSVAPSRLPTSPSSSYSKLYGISNRSVPVYGGG